MEVMVKLLAPPEASRQIYSSLPLYFILVRLSHLQLQIILLHLTIREKDKKTKIYQL